MNIITIRFNGEPVSFNFGCKKFIPDFVQFVNQELKCLAVIEEASKPVPANIDQKLVKEGIIQAFQNWKLLNYYEV